MLIVRFGIPEHGWLPVEIEAGNYALLFEASDVPINPLNELCSALISVAYGKSADVNWHLEPTWYHFHFETNDEMITLTIIASERYGLKADAQFSITGTFESLVLPIYRELKSFAVTDYGTDWPSADSARIKKLTELIKARKKQA
jgi:hypothetical protein